MRHYEIPDQVIRQIELGFKPYITACPQQSLDLARELWKDDYFEFIRSGSLFAGSARS